MALSDGAIFFGVFHCRHIFGEATKIVSFRRKLFKSVDRFHWNIIYQFLHIAVKLNENDVKTNFNRACQNFYLLSLL